MKRGVFRFDAVGMTRLTFGKMLQSEKRKDETHDEYDIRCCKERCHSLPDGRVIVPPIAFRQVGESAAKLRSESVPGKGAAKFTQRFKTGLMLDPTAPPTVVYRIIDGEEQAVTLDNIDVHRVMVPSDGRRGGTKRVPRNFPEVDPPWVVHVSLIVVDLDLMAHPDVLTRCFETGGIQVGIGCNRAERSGGDHGSFRVVNPSFEVVS